jgi:hypothetical protein
MKNTVLWDVELCGLVRSEVSEEVSAIQLLNLFLVDGFFHPEAGSDTSKLNVGFHKINIGSYHRRRHSKCIVVSRRHRDTVKMSTFYITNFHCKRSKNKRGIE